MGIKKIVLEPTIKNLNMVFDGEYCEIILDSEKTVQIRDPAGLVITVSTQILPIDTPVTTHNGYLISQEHLILDIPEELRLPINKDEQRYNRIICTLTSKGEKQ